MDKIALIQEKIDNITNQVQILNTMLTQIAPEELRSAELQVRYWFGGAGSAAAGLGFKSIIPINEEHTRGKAFQTDIDYDYYRKKLRANFVNEAEIWIRFPAKTEEELQEKETRMKKYNEKRERKILVHDPFKAYCLAEAKQKAKQTQVPIETILADENFIRSCREVWEIVL
jgi:hypothetical protein